MGVRPYKQASCLFCKEKFDRNKIPFIITNPESTRPRYIHASCGDNYAKKTNRILEPVINPATHSICEYCHRAVSNIAAIALSGDRFAHKECSEANNARIKTEAEQLFDYIKLVYDESFVDPAKQKAIKKMMDDFGFTYSGIHGTLVYLYEVLKKKPSDSNYLGIVPWHYTQAKAYYENLTKVNAANAKIDIENYKPKEMVVKRKERERFDPNKNKFSILDEENINAE